MINVMSFRGRRVSYLNSAQKVSEQLRAKLRNSVEPSNLFMSETCLASIMMFTISFSDVGAEALSLILELGTMVLGCF